MTTYTSLGEHHMKVHKTNLNSTTRGNDHAKGKSYLWIFGKQEHRRVYSRRLRELEKNIEKRLQRKRDRIENVLSKEEEFLAELYDANQEYGL